MGWVTVLLSDVGRRLALWGALTVAVGVALWVAYRRGRHAAEAEFIIRRADARIRAMTASKETRHEVRYADRIDLEHRADRWMRD
jgi:hypothetical protein